MKLNLANKLTILRLILIIPFSFFLINSFTPSWLVNIPFRIIAIAIFILASITDYYDGYVARNYDMVTDLGKLLDPIADKLLTFAALIILMENDYVPFIYFLIILVREIYITNLRLVYMSKCNEVVPAFLSGKLKTAFLMLGLILLMVLPTLSAANVYFGYMLLLPSVVLTVYSAITYSSYMLGRLV